MAKIYATSALNMRTLTLGDFYSRNESHSSAVAGRTLATTVHGENYADYFQLTFYNFSNQTGQTLRFLSTADLSQPSNGAPFNSPMTGAGNGLTLFDGASGQSLTERWHIGGITLDITAFLEAIQTFDGADDRNLLKAELGGADTFDLSAQSDFVFGYGGSDTIRGNDGGDFIRGGTGRDHLYGGAGADDFIFDDRESGRTATTRDVIFDFARSVDDLDLRLIDANTARSGDQLFSFNGTKAGANDVWYTRSGSNVIVNGDTNGDARADFQIELRGVTALSAGDFLL